mmetsp:Transcript_43352/g.103971  ORF Transcript_43352/g.103971 Transcript_43352/m.103971 type:complete len:203 (+) Transcript_43352:435-1043(+)
MPPGVPVHLHEWLKTVQIRQHRLALLPRQLMDTLRPSWLVSRFRDAVRTIVVEHVTQVPAKSIFHIRQHAILSLPRDDNIAHVHAASETGCAVVDVRADQVDEEEPNVLQRERDAEADAPRRKAKKIGAHDGLFFALFALLTPSFSPVLSLAGADDDQSGGHGDAQFHGQPQHLLPLTDALVLDWHRAPGSKHELEAVAADF